MSFRARPSIALASGLDDETSSCSSQIDCSATTVEHLDKAFNNRFPNLDFNNINQVADVMVQLVESHRAQFRDKQFKRHQKHQALQDMECIQYVANKLFDSHCCSRSEHDIGTGNDHSIKEIQKDVRIMKSILTTSPYPLSAPRPTYADIVNATERVTSGPVKRTGKIKPALIITPVDDN